MAAFKNRCMSIVKMRGIPIGEVRVTQLEDGHIFFDMFTPAEHQGNAKLATENLFGGMPDE